MFEMAHLNEESLREYDELEFCYLEIVNNAGKQREFGGMEHGYDQAAILNPNNKQLSQIVLDNSFREFEFRQYLFACQAKLLFKLKRPFEVASRGFSFISGLPFCLREVWVLTSCLRLVNATADHYKNGLVAPEIENEFYRPAIWPSAPSDASSEVVEKGKMILEATSRIKHFGIQKKPLPLEPSSLLNEANRQRDSQAQASPPLKLVEVFVAAQHALRKTIC